MVPQVSPVWRSYYCASANTGESCGVHIRTNIEVRHTNMMAFCFPCWQEYQYLYLCVCFVCDFAFEVALWVGIYEKKRKKKVSQIHFLTFQFWRLPDPQTGRVYSCTDAKSKSILSYSKETNLSSFKKNLFLEEVELALTVTEENRVMESSIFITSHNPSPPFLNWGPMVSKQLPQHHHPKWDVLGTVSNVCFYSVKWFTFLWLRNVFVYLR